MTLADVDINVLITIGGMLLAGGVAWGGARTGATSTQKAIVELKDQVISHISDDSEREVDRLKTAIVYERRMARLETLISEVHGRVVKARRSNDDDPLN